MHAHAQGRSIDMQPVTYSVTDDIYSEDGITSRGKARLTFPKGRAFVQGHAVWADDIEETGIAPIWWRRPEAHFRERWCIEHRYIWLTKYTCKIYDAYAQSRFI